MNSYVHEIVVEPDKFEDGGEAWHASCPALKGCHSWGHSYEEALANIREPSIYMRRTSSKPVRPFPWQMC